MGKILIENGIIVNRGRTFKGFVAVDGERITEVGEGVSGVRYDNFGGRRIDAAGCFVIPGVIDDHVHFREPGLTYKGDIHSESTAAVAGGVTSYMEMPNTVPPASAIDILESKYDRAAETSAANYSFYLGASHDNIEEIRKIDPRRVCGLKLFMGSSTGGMLVDDEKSLEAVFAESPVIVAAHCEDEAVIKANMEAFRAKYGDGITPEMHPLIRSAEACYRSSARGVALADKYGTDFHIMHLSTERELSLFDKKPLTEKKITAEVCVHHLWFSDRDYASKGNLIKCNPAVKSVSDRDALRRAVLDGRADIVATDHAPHTLEEKQRPYLQAPSGIPLVQHSLAAMLDMVSEGLFGVEKVVEKMCHAPAERFRIKGRGFLDTGMYADIVIAAPSQGPPVGRDNILYKCGWSPFEGVAFRHTVTYTIINGSVVYSGGTVDSSFRGKHLEFDR